LEIFLGDLQLDRKFSVRIDHGLDLFCIDIGDHGNLKRTFDFKLLSELNDIKLNAFLDSDF
jgi:hypothetical protein